MMNTDHAAGGGDSKHAEHKALLALVPHAEATHVAIASGDWSDPAIWRNGAVPGHDARVLVPTGVTVEYGDVRDARLFTVRVDGHLRFATDTDSRMVVDTLVVADSGRLTIGTAGAPVQPGVSVDIVIAGNGAIDTHWDPMLLSRGLVSSGAVEIHGAEKDSHLKVAVDPLAGDAALTLAAAPEGWRPGDTIVIAGTNHEGYKWDNAIRAVRYHEPEDEVRTIVKIEGSTVFLDRPLVHDHETPRADLKTSVANYTRSVTIATEDPAVTAASERGHVMFMHSDAVDVRYAAFHELGRTDKSVPSVDVADVMHVESDTNVRGRYAFHLHRTGADDPDHPAIVIGNAVYGSPGWGFVHHDSNALLHANASYDTFGAGFVAETGNEIGRWSDNIAIDAQGAPGLPKNAGNIATFDIARTGSGFWFQGRLVESAGNIAASVNHGFVYLHRDSTDGDMIAFDPALFDFPEALGLGGPAWPDDAPILHFTDNEAFAAGEGLHVVKANPNQGHDVRTVMSDFTAWNVVNGAHFEYTSHYTLLKFDLIGKTATPFNKSKTGISFGPNTTDMVIVDPTIDNFLTAGIDLFKSLINRAQDPSLHRYVVTGATITGSPTPLRNLDPAADTILAETPESVGTISVALDGPLVYREGWPDPTARIVAIGGTKTDTLGSSPLPSGLDNYNVRRDDVIKILETDGYFSTADGRNYFVLEAYYGDRLTGEVEKFGHLVQIDPSVKLGNPHGAYAHARFNGPLVVPDAAPVTRTDAARTAPQTAVTLDVLANDGAAGGLPIRLDGLAQPVNGRVVDNGDGTITYTPDIGFTGEDVVKYWVTDGYGSFTPGWAVVTVGTTAPPPVDPPVDPPDGSAPPAGTPLVGTAGADTLIFRSNAVTAWGGDGADRFRVDARGIADGTTFTVLDFDPAAGDVLELRHFRQGLFDDRADPANALATGYGGRHATVDSLADLREIVAADAGLERTAAGDAVLLLPTEAGGTLRLVIAGLSATRLGAAELPTPPRASPIPETAPAGTRLVGTDGPDSLVFRDVLTTAFGGAGADSFRLDARAVAGGTALVVHDLRFDEGDTLVLRHFAENSFFNAAGSDNHLDVGFSGRHVTIDSITDLQEIVAGPTRLGQTAAGDAILHLPTSDGTLSVVLIGTPYDMLA